ncbi:hypothetical protein QCA50_002588 [Cerrena zonata]|uniref:Secreted protein n=1 Tax=Cerrena zonata TaxID=2478898 RepID=A0AAW0GI72_9APHY
MRTQYGTVFRQVLTVTFLSVLSPSIFLYANTYNCRTRQAQAPFFAWSITSNLRHLSVYLSHILIDPSIIYARGVLRLRSDFERTFEICIMSIIQLHPILLTAALRHPTCPSSKPRRASLSSPTKINRVTIYPENASTGLVVTC